MSGLWWLAVCRCGWLKAVSDEGRATFAFHGHVRARRRRGEPDSRHVRSFGD